MTPTIVQSRLYGPRKENVIADVVRCIAAMGGKVVFETAQIGAVIKVTKAGKSMNLHGSNAADAASQAFRNLALWRFLAPANDKPPRKAAQV